MNFRTSTIPAIGSWERTCPRCRLGQGPTLTLSPHLCLVPSLPSAPFSLQEQSTPGTEHQDPPGNPASSPRPGTAQLLQGPWPTRAVCLFQSAMLSHSSHWALQRKNEERARVEGQASPCSLTQPRLCDPSGMLLDTTSQVQCGPAQADNSAWFSWGRVCVCVV